MIDVYGSKKRILLITENLGSGGAERQLTGLAVLLKERGYDVKVITYIERQFYEPYLREHEVDYELVKEAVNKYMRVYHIWRKLRVYRPDVVISYLPSVNKTMCLVRMFYKTRLIISERSHTMNWHLFTRIHFSLYSIADKVVANSVSEAENISMHMPHLKKKVLAIPNFVDTERFCPAVCRSKNNSVLKILGVGRLIPVKNVLRILQAFKQVIDRGSRCEMLWVGAQFDTVYLKKVKDEIKTLCLDDSFHLQAQTDDIVSVYQQADIFCLPSLFEGYPNVLCEAMSCGLPVVCSNVCDNPFIVEDGVNGLLFNPISVDDMEVQLLKMVRMSSKEREVMSKASRQISETKFSQLKFVDSYVRLIDEKFSKQYQ